MEIDVKRADLDKFRQLYSTLLGFFVLEYVLVNSRIDSISKDNFHVAMKDAQRKSLFEFILRDSLDTVAKVAGLASRVFDAYENYFQANPQINRQEPLDLANFSQVAWNEVAKIMGSDPKKGSLGFVPLAIFWGHISTSAFERIKQKLNNRT